LQFVILCTEIILVPSNAFTNHLEVLLKDAEELDEAHRQLRTGAAGRQWKLGALNRAVVVTCVSSWEAYVEKVLVECTDLLKPSAPPLGIWPSLSASARSDIGRFSNPNAENTRRLFADNLGLEDVSDSWSWQNCEPQKARDLLNDVLKNRHQVAHGVNPRPIIHNQYSSWLPGFFRNLGRCTDAALNTHLSSTLGIASPW
jgi:hypothetical protein